MNVSVIFDSLNKKTPSEAKQQVMYLYSAMSTERFFKHMRNMEEMARQSGREKEQEETVCRLLASGMSVEEITVILCVRAETVRLIERNNAATAIPEYTKKLKERQRRRERQR